jgi:hypothetical protein
MQTKLKVEVHPYHLENHYSPLGKGEIGFALFSKKDSKRIPTTMIFTCRDYINDSMIVDKNNSTFSYYNAKTRIDWNRLRLALYTHSAMDEKEDYRKLLFATKIINFYENIGKFSRRTKIVPADHDYEKVKVWLLYGPKEWMKSTHLVSMITLIFRVVYKTRINFPTKISNINDIHSFFDKAIHTLYCYDSSYIGNYRTFETLMRKFHKIFNLSEEVLFPNSQKMDWHSCGGIFSLCNFSSGIQELNENLKNELRKRK